MPTTTNDKPVDQEPTIAAPPEPAIAKRIGFGQSAETWDTALRMANKFAESSLVPKAYRGHPEDIVVAMQYGAEIGLPPMAALQSIDVIGGKPGLYGDGFLGVIMASPPYVKHAEFYVLGNGEVVDGLRTVDLLDDETRAISKFWRRGIAEPFVGEFSIADAKRARLWAKDGPWTTNPPRMLKWRAREFAGRDGFADVLRGMAETTSLQDRDDLPRDDAAPVDPPIRRSTKIANVAVPVPVVEQAPRLDLDGARHMAAPPPNVAQIVDGMVITDTAVVQPPNADPYWEVRARVDKKGAAPVAVVFRTYDRGVYDLAQSAEGTTQHFSMTWHVEKPAAAPTTDKGFKVLDELVAD